MLRETDPHWTAGLPAEANVARGDVATLPRGRAMTFQALAGGDDGAALRAVRVDLQVDRSALRRWQPYTASQRAMYAAAIAGRPLGDQRSPKSVTVPSPTTEEAARAAGVAQSQVIDAKAVRRDTIPEVVAAGPERARQLVRLTGYQGNRG